MAFLKQFLVTVLVLIAGAALWMAFDARPGRYVLQSGYAVPDSVRGLIVAISPEGVLEPEPAAEAANASQRAGGGNPAGRSGGGGGGRGSGPAVVVAGTVETSVTQSQMRAIGTGEAERSITVYPDVTGIIKSVPFKSGDEVAAGSVLAVLQDDSERLALDRARIGVAAAEEKLERFQRLQASRTITQVEVGDVEREVENARLDLRGAEIALEKRSILAPIAGRVGIVGVDTGDLVSNQTVIATIDDRARLKVIFYTPESFVQELRIGGPIEAASIARPDKLYTGRITAIESRLDEASRTLRTEATIDNPQDELRPGMSFGMNLALEGVRHLSVDPLAVQWERSGAIVWKIAGTDVVKAKVRIVERNIDRVLVASDDLKEGDQVVVEGLQSVREGGKVEVQNPLAPPPAEPPAAPAAPVAGSESGAANAAEIAQQQRAGGAGGVAAR